MVIWYYIHHMENTGCNLAWWCKSNAKRGRDRLRLGTSRRKGILAVCRVELSRTPLFFCLFLLSNLYDNTKQDESVDFRNGKKDGGLDSSDGRQMASILRLAIYKWNHRIFVVVLHAHSNLHVSGRILFLTWRICHNAMGI